MKSIYELSFAPAGILNRARQVRSRGTLTIVMYHGLIDGSPRVPDWCFVERRAFVRQMRYLKRWFDVRPLSEAVRALARGEITTPTAAVTFDDGLASTGTIGFPVLRDLDLPATIFLTSGLIGTSDTLWYCRLINALSHSRVQTLRWGDHAYNLSGYRSRGRASRDLQARLKRLPHQRLLHEVGEIENLLGAPEVSDHAVRMLDSEAIRRMAASGLIEFGAHTMTHPILTKVPLAEARAEVERSLSTTSDLTGTSATLFAYPNGSQEDINSEVISIVVDSGVHAAVTTVEGKNVQQTDPMLLHRYGIGANENLLRFALRVHGVTGTMRRMRDGLLA